MSTRLHEARRTDLLQWRARDLPALSATDRIALRVGLALIVWGRRHATPVDRGLLAERRRLLRVAADAELARDRAAARRHAGGQVL